MKTRAPLIIAVVLLILPVLYVGSYFALVVPGGFLSPRPRPDGLLNFGQQTTEHYRVGREWSERVFWPLEQLDRQVRPDSWKDDLWIDPYFGPQRGPYPTIEPPS